MSSGRKEFKDSGPVPDRWLRCPRKSQSLIADKFLAFKTPLSASFDTKVPPQYRFPPAMLFSSMKGYRVRIGLWIDLTHTTRFYDPEEVKHGLDDEKEVGYIKLQCRGHGETPTPEQTKVFIQICEKYIRKHPLEIIGVHCTHGFNRTGFLIVCYMVEVMDWSVQAAIVEFARARPPGIYKQDYIDELYRRYDPEEDEVFKAPALPDWCLEYEDDDQDDDGNTIGSSGSRKRAGRGNWDNGNNKRNRSDKVPEFMEGISGVSPVLDQPKLSELQRTAQEMCGWESKGFPGCQPVSMDKDNISLLRDRPYMVSWKADGTRYMMLIRGENEVYCIDRDNSVFQVQGLKFVRRKNLNEHLTGTLLDGEMVIDKHNGQSIPRYLVYDVLCVDNIDVKNMTFPRRLSVIDADIIKPRHQAIAQGRIDKSVEPFSIRAKMFFPVEKAGSFLSEKFARQLSHEPDGLIFQPSAEPYKPGQCLEVLKWKPASHNSVDFRLKIGKEDGLGLLPTKIGFLYVGGHDQPFGRMKVTKPIKDLNNKIIECKIENNNWVFMRERTDKSFPNSYDTAVSVCKSITNPVTKEILLDFIERERFRSDDELMPPPPSGSHHHHR